MDSYPIRHSPGTIRTYKKHATSGGLTFTATARISFVPRLEPEFL
jgi:hypothetical protein